MTTVFAITLLASIAGVSPTSHRLYSSQAEASSFLKSNWNKYEENYHPTYVLDDDPKTAWVEGVDGDGAGQWLQLPLSTLSTARQLTLVIANGYQKSLDLLEANAAPKKVTVIVNGPAGVSGRVTATLERRMGTQEIPVPLTGGVQSVRIVVDEVTPGKVYRDMCISDVQVWVDSSVPYNAKAEDAKRAAASAWKQERVATAQYFAKLPKDFPWAATRFDGDPVVRTSVAFTEANAKGKRGLKPAFANGIESLLAAHDPALTPLSDADRDALQRLLALRADKRPPGAILRRIEPAGPRARSPDGIWFTQNTEAYLSLADLVLTEAAAAGATRKAPIPDPGTGFGSLTTGEAVVVKRADATVEQLFVPITSVLQERSVVTDRSHWLFTYDAQGRLLSSASVTHEQELDGLMLEHPRPEDMITTTVPVEFFEVTDLHRNAAGKIDRVVVKSGGVQCDYEKADGSVQEGCWYVVTERISVPST